MTRKKVLIRKNKDDKESPLVLSNRQITGQFTISQTIDIPNIDYKAVNTPKPKVEQREGLKLKHFATGYAQTPIEEEQIDAKSIDSIEEESQNKQNSPKKEKKRESSGKDDKHKHKKHKKDK